MWIFIITKDSQKLIEYRGTYKGDVTKTPSENEQVEIEITLNGIILDIENNLLVTPEQKTLWKMCTNEISLGKTYLVLNDSKVYLNNESVDFRKNRRLKK